jgi:hypothetical protein
VRALHPRARNTPSPLGAWISGSADQRISGSARLRSVYPHLLSAGAQRGECRMPGGERQGAGSCECELAGCRRKRASLHQLMALGIANKAAAAVLLSVNR